MGRWAYRIKQRPMRFLYLFMVLGISVHYLGWGAVLAIGAYTLDLEWG